MAQITLNSSGVASSGSLLLQTNGTTTQATVDTSGNLGLGVTPSAWNTSRKVLQGTGAALMLTSGNNSLATLFANTYENTSGVYTYQNTAAASYYQQYNGAHSWYYAASGTGGTTATFTQAMTLDASGNLFLGATSAGFAEKFRVYGNYSVFDNGTFTGFIGSGSSLGTGTGSDFAIRSSNAIAFLSGGATERARIDSSGRWLVNTTSAALSASKAQISYSPSADYGLVLYPTNTTYNNASVLFLNNAGTSVGYIYSTGSATTYSTTSDYRLKENIAPMTGALEKVAALKPCTYTWKADGSVSQGFIAHELQAVVPEAVVGEKDAVDEDGNPKYQGIDTSFLVATLTAALQEAHGLIKDLQARVAALES